MAGEEDRALSRLAPQATLKSDEHNLQAVTTVNYLGRIGTVWCENPEANLVESHLASVQTAIQLRMALVHLVVTIGSAVTAISLVITNPLTAIMALSSVRELRQAIESFVTIASESA